MNPRTLSRCLTMASSWPALESTGASRRALYGRTRTALVEALRKFDPPLSDSEITRERLSLEAAIRKVEAGAVHGSRVEASGALTLAKVEAGDPPASDQESDADRSMTSGLQPAPDVPLPNSEPMPKEKPDAMNVVEDEAHLPVRDRNQERIAVPPTADAAREPFAAPRAAGVNADAGAASVAHTRSRTQQLEPVPFRGHRARGLLVGPSSDDPDLDRFRLSLETAFRAIEADPADSRNERKRDGKPAADSEAARARTGRQSNNGATASVPDLDDVILSLEGALRNAQATAVESRIEVKPDAKQADPIGTLLPGRANVTEARPEANREERARLCRRGSLNRASSSPGPQPGPPFSITSNVESNPGS